MVMHGGCQCREVRYTIDMDEAAVKNNFCHCRLCQLATGSPVSACFTIPQVLFHLFGVLCLYKMRNYLRYETIKLVNQPSTVDDRPESKLKAS